jgi:hypothetical protein
VVRVFRQKQNKAKTELTVCEEDRDSSPSYTTGYSHKLEPQREEYKWDCGKSCIVMGCGVGYSGERT